MGETMVKGAKGAKVKVIFQGLPAYDMCHLCIGLWLKFFNFEYPI
jgi:hypothetical protein